MLRNILANTVLYALAALTGAAVVVGYMLHPPPVVITIADKIFRFALRFMASRSTPRR